MAPREILIFPCYDGQDKSYQPNRCGIPPGARHLVPFQGGPTRYLQ